MFNLSRIIIMALLVAFALAAVLTIVLAVYYSVYKKNINKALEENDGTNHRMPPPYKVLLILAGMALLGVVAFVSCKAAGMRDDGPEDRYYNALYGFNVYQPEEMTGYLSAYSIEENEGYEKQVVEQGDVRFTYFIDENEYNIWHPKFLVYVEYIGEKPVKYRGYNGTFKDHEEHIINGLGAAGNDAKEYFVIVGNTSIDCIFTVQAFFYDGESKGEEMSDGSVASESINIYLP